MSAIMAAAEHVWQSDTCNRTIENLFYWTNPTIVSFINKRDEPVYNIAMKKENTQQENLNKTLQNTEERLNMAMSVANDGIWDWHLKNNNVYFDERYYTMAGYQPFEFAGEFDQFQQRVHPDHIKPLLKEIESYLQGEPDIFDVEFRFKRKDSSYMWIRGRGKVVERDDEGKPLRFVGTHSDISIRKHTEQKLVESEQRYRQIFESSQAVKLLIDTEDGRIVEANEAAARFYGYDLATLTSMPFSRINALFEKEIKRRALTPENNKSMRFECRHNLASGEVRDVEVYSNTVKIGSKGYLYLIAQDISERIKAEKQLRRAQKMDAIGQLTGGISHDFNNILGIILGNANLLGQQLEQQPVNNEKTKRRINAIKDSTQRAIDLTRQLLDFSRIKASSVKVIDINHIVTNMHNLLVHSLTPQIEVEHRLTDDLWLAQINPSNLGDSLLNLLINARDAMSGNGKIVIESNNITLTSKHFEHSAELPPGDYIELAVHDNGEGMTAEQQEHIFEPFYTTKEQGKGTGLGLAMVFAFAKRSNGSITVQSEPGTGTTFRLYLPRHIPEITIKEAPTTTNTEQGENLASGNETILVVDDEALLLELVQESLQSLGYHVLCAKNGEQALQILHDKQTVGKAGVDLLFSDVVMPGISGIDLAEQAHKAHPALRVLLTSGYTDKTIADNGKNRFSANLLRKPYSPSELARRLRQVLDSPALSD